MSVSIVYYWLCVIKKVISYSKQRDWLRRGTHCKRCWRLWYRWRCHPASAGDSGSWGTSVWSGRCLWCGTGWRSAAGARAGRRRTTPVPAPPVAAAGGAGAGARRAAPMAAARAPSRLTLCTCHADTHPASHPSHTSRTSHTSHTSHAQVTWLTRHVTHSKHACLDSTQCLMFARSSNCPNEAFVSKVAPGLGFNKSIYYPIVLIGAL